MLSEVAHLDRQSWRARSAEMGSLVRHQIENAPTGVLMQTLLREQVGLITSIPIEAAERVQRLSIESLINSTRASELAAEIMRSGDVAKSRAMTIARTEVSRAHSTFTEVRAKSAGSEGYIWRTSRDGDVRKSHKAMEGKLVLWGAPPTLDKMTGHAGCFPNCRCFPEPVFP